MSVDSAISIAWDVLKCLVVPIKRQFGYVISTKRYAQDLKQEVETLECEVQRVQPIVEEADNNLRNIYRHFSDWQGTAEKALTEAKHLGGNFENVSKNCCYGTLPDPIIRYRFSRKAKETIEGIQELAKKGKEFKEVNDISCSRPPSGRVPASTTTPAAGSASSSSTSIELGEDGIFKSRALIIWEIMDALANSSNRVVGIHGMGGVGKSTLLVDAERIIREKKSFDWVAKADVTKNPDIKRIQGEIAHWLGLSDIKNEESISGRAELLRKRLENEEREKKKVLIILDNLWERLNLKSVGIPCGHDNKVMGCKLLLTSRDRNILRIEMGSDRDFHLGGLQEEEARGLFEKIVGPKVHDEEFKPWVEEALDRCAGVPFLIVAMAKRLKHAELVEWKDTLRKIMKSIDKNINDMIDHMLQWSYDRLEDEVKSLLQLCVVYGISKPSLENLLRYGVGLRIFGGVTNMEETRDRLSSHIRTLQASSLLLDSEDVDSFKIHDLVREFVEQVASRDHPLLVLKDKNKLITELSIDRLKRCRAICFPFVDIKELPEELDCPQLQIFLLFTNFRYLSLRESYFNSMRELMVLNLEGICFTRLSLSFRSLENLHSLCLDNCMLKDIATLGELKGLEILSLAHTTIEQLPKEIGKLVELRMLDLNFCRGLRTIEPGVLGSMIKLEELYVLNNFFEGEREQTPITNAILIELNNKKNLRTLHVTIPDPSILPEDLSFEKLTKYKIQIGRVKGWGRVYKGMRTLDLKLNPTDNIIQKGCLHTTLDRTDELFLDGLIDQSICELSQEGFPKLKHLHVQNNPSLHCIIRRSTAFKTLESLALQNLVNLKKISNKTVSSNSFNALEVVRVERCDRMEALFPFSVVRELPQLQKMEVVDCMLTQGIVEAGDGGKVEWPNLHELILRKLPYMKSFFTSRMAPSSSTSDNQNGTTVAFFNGHQVAFPNLETLKIVAVGNIDRIWDNHVHFGHLKTLHVSHCDKLSHIFTPKIVGNLVELTRLTIERCNILTEVIVDEGGDTSCVVAFKKLKYLELLKLTRLRYFNSGGHTLMFPILEDVIMIGCLNMKFFSKGPIEAPKLGKVRLTNNDMVCMENLNISNPHLFEEMAIAGVKKLWLSEFPELIEKWNKLIPVNSSWQLSSLVVNKCSSFINAIPSRLMLVLENMDTLNVGDCEELEEIFDLEGLDGVESTRVLPRLRNISFVNLPKLRRLWNNDLQGRLRFSHLNVLSLYKCGDLKYVFTPSVARSLETLTHMEITECGQMECVIAEEEGQGSATVEITFPRLYEMTLERLPKLISFLSGKKHTLEFPSLYYLTITHCPKMRSLIGQSSTEIDQGTPSLFPTQVQCPQLKGLVLSHMDHVSNIWNNGLPETHISKTLLEVEVENCKSLEYLFPHWLANSLNHLRKLLVEYCEFKEIIMSKDDALRSTTNQVFFPELTSLMLHEMPQLKSFCLNLSTLKLSSLQELRVTHCHELQMSSSVALMNKWTQRDDEKNPPDQEAHPSIKWDFPMLDKLLLVKDDIKRIQDGDLADDIYGKPVALTLACFHDEMDIFPSRSLLERFHNLQSLEIFCSSFEDIFPDDEPPVLENLTELKLSKLRNLRRVWRKDCLVSKIFQSIRTLYVWECPVLTILFPTVTSFQNLTGLVVENCSGLIHLLIVSEDINLVHLSEMTIVGCERMEEVVANDGNREGKVISFESLETLTLQNMPSLLYFSSDTSCVCRFPSLSDIIVEECPKMKIFSRGVLRMSSPGYETLFKYRCDVGEEDDGDLNTVIQKLSA